ncbi:MAG: hypothetical protein QW359_02750 [Metallosphaera sp.]
MKYITREPLLNIVRSGLLIIAGIAAAITLAYISVIIASMPIYPFHQRYLRDDIETGIYFDEKGISPVFLPQTANGINTSYQTAGSNVSGNNSVNFPAYTVINYSISINNSSNPPIFIVYAPVHECVNVNNISVYPVKIYSTSNGIVKFTILPDNNGLVHMTGDNRFYRVIEFEEVLLPNNSSIVVTLKLNDLPPGELWIPIWNHCEIEYIEVVIQG